MILLIDNYDSFSYNLVQAVGGILKGREEIKVIRNDDMTPEEIGRLGPSKIILSPGPGRPSDAGVCEEVLRRFGDHIPILGVCLGHQAICEVFGGKIIYAKTLMHGKQSTISVDTGCELFRGLPGKMKAARYHSLAAEPESLPEVLTVVGKDADGEIMAVKHRDYPVNGLQFHPESVLTPDGVMILKNFLGL